MLKELAITPVVDVPPTVLLDYISEHDGLSRAIVARYHWGHGYFSTNLVEAWRRLASIADKYSMRGEVFVEWGSGLAGVSVCAAQLGFQATAIEQDARLCREATRLAQLVEWPIHVRQDSFLSGRLIRNHQGSDFRGVKLVEQKIRVATRHRTLFFAYPWPGELGLIKEVFEGQGAEHDLLLCHLGVDEFALFAKE